MTKLSLLKRHMLSSMCLFSWVGETPYSSLCLTNEIDGKPISCEDYNANHHVHGQS